MIFSALRFFFTLRSFSIDRSCPVFYRFRLPLFSLSLFRISSSFSRFRSSFSFVVFVAFYVCDPPRFNRSFCLDLISFCLIFTVFDTIVISSCFISFPTFLTCLPHFLLIFTLTSFTVSMGIGRAVWAVLTVTVDVVERLGFALLVLRMDRRFRIALLRGSSRFLRIRFWFIMVFSHRGSKRKKKGREIRLHVYRCVRLRLRLRSRLRLPFHVYTHVSFTRLRFYHVRFVRCVCHTSFPFVRSYLLRSTFPRLHFARSSFCRLHFRCLRLPFVSFSFALYRCSLFTFPSERMKRIWISVCIIWFVVSSNRHSKWMANNIMDFFFL